MSKLENTFADLWIAYYPAIDLHSEYRFASPRRFRFDFACPLAKVAIEINGGIWTDGRHSRGSGLATEYEKINLASSLGWRVFHLCTNTIEDEVIYRMIAETIIKAKEKT